MNLYKCPGAKTLLSSAVVQYGIVSGYDTLYLPKKYNYRRVPLWTLDKNIARLARCSARVVYRWRKAHGIGKYNADYSRPGYPRKMRIAA